MRLVDRDRAHIAGTRGAAEGEVDQLIRASHGYRAEQQDYESYSSENDRGRWLAHTRTIHGSRREHDMSVKLFRP